MNLAIVVITYNLPADIFLLQMEAIGEFCKDPHTIEVIDNSSNYILAEHLRYHASVLSLSYMKTFSSAQNSSESHSFAANFAYHHIRNRYTHMLFLDHDLLPVKPFSVTEILGEQYLLAGLGQGARKTYMWPGCVMFNNEKIDQSLVDFSPNHEYGLDTGGNFYRLIENIGKDKCLFFNETYHENPFFKDPQYGHYAMLNNEMFFHFVAASNWMEKDRNEERLNSLKNIVTEMINGKAADIL